MHMADALVTPAVAGVMAACSAAAAGYSIKKVRLSEDPKKIPVMGVMGAFVFAAQMINFTIPGTGSSGHLCGGMMLSALLGPHAGFLTMIGVLLVQCLFFADGGLLALGCNVWNMAFYGCLETLASGVTELPFGVFLAAMQPIHLAIGAVEGLITAAVLSFVYEARPELLWGVGTRSGEGRLSYKTTLGILAAAAVFVGGMLSLFASSLPDGLEWAMERTAGTAELEAEGGAYSIAAGIQKALSFLPDYAFPGSESAAGTAVSGIVGALLVLLLCLLFCRLFRFFRRKTA